MMEYNTPEYTVCTRAVSLTVKLNHSNEQAETTKMVFFLWSECHTQM